MNGQRFEYGAVDTNLLPMAAIGRVEILKDGAAATYGSDAIGGVVNFITRTDLQGFDISADNRFVRGSNGDRTASFAYGWKGKSGNVLVSAGVQDRSELSAVDRNWSYVPYSVNSNGYSAASNPGTYFLSPYSFPAVADVGCSALGGHVSGTSCDYSYVPYENLIEREKRRQIYAEANASLSDSVRFHGEALYSLNDTPNLRTAPSFTPFYGPTGPFTNFIVPATNPGAAAALSQAGLGPQDTYLNAYGWSPFALGGNPVDGGMGGASAQRRYSLFRTSSSLDGDIGESTHWKVSGTYTHVNVLQQGPDILAGRLQAALDGLGGPNCTGTTPGANGCEYFNPFSTAIPSNPALGLTNPYYDPSLANDPALDAWLFADSGWKSATNYWVLDAVVDGETGIQLGDGPISYAVGAQERGVSTVTDPVNAYSNALVNPCPTLGDTTCTLKTGPFLLLSPTYPSRLSQNVDAFYGELHLPFTDKLSAQLAVRYEDYGGQTGSTVNPKLAFKWQATDWLAFRGSVGTTFRGPTPADVAPGGGSGVTYISQAGPYGSFLPVVSYGNPAEAPEKALTYNFGALFKTSDFSASVDYWSYRLKDQIVQTPAASIAGAVIDSKTGLADCANPLAGLITFDNNNTCTQGVTAGVNMAGISQITANGPTVHTDGIDISADYYLDDVWDGTLTFRTDATRILKYDQAQFNYLGVELSPAYSALGYLNSGRLPGAISKWRGSLSAEYDRGQHSLNARLNYIEGVTDDTRLPGGANTAVVTTDPVHGGAYTTVDLTYMLQLTPTWSFNASVLNLFDKDPPLTIQTLNYNAAIADPYGRSFKVGVRMQF